MKDETYAFIGCNRLERFSVDKANPIFFSDEMGALYARDESQQKESLIRQRPFPVHWLIISPKLTACREVFYLLWA